MLQRRSRIRILLADGAVTIPQVAVQSGVSRSTLRDMASPQWNPRSDTLDKVCLALVEMGFSEFGDDQKDMCGNPHIQEAAEPCANLSTEVA